MVTKPKKRDLLTSKRCPQSPTLLIIFLRKNTQHTHMHTHSHYEKETKPTWGHWVEWSWTTCRSADVRSAFTMYSAGCWDHSKEWPHGPRACPHGLTAWWGLWLWTGIHTTQQPQLRGRFRGLGSTEGTSELGLGLGNRQRFARGTESKAAPCWPLWACKMETIRPISQGGWECYV